MLAAGIGEDFLEMCGKNRNGKMNYALLHILYALGYYMDGKPADAPPPPLKHAKRILAISESEVAEMREKVKDMTEEERVEYAEGMIPELESIWEVKAKAVIKKYEF